MSLGSDGQGSCVHTMSVAGRAKYSRREATPTLAKAIAFARIPAGEAGEVSVDIRGKLLPARIVKFPFVRDGKPVE